MWSFFFFGEVRDRFRDKCAPLYMCLCLCCRQDVLQEEIRDAADAKTLEFLITRVETIERKLRAIRLLYTRKKRIADADKFASLAHYANRELAKLNTQRPIEADALPEGLPVERHYELEEEDEVGLDFVEESSMAEISVTTEHHADFKRQLTRIKSQSLRDSARLSAKGRTESMASLASSESEESTKRSISKNKKQFREGPRRSLFHAKSKRANSSLGGLMVSGDLDSFTEAQKAVSPRTKKQYQKLRTAVRQGRAERDGQTEVITAGCSDGRPVRLRPRRAPVRVTASTATQGSSRGRGGRAESDGAPEGRRLYN